MLKRILGLVLLSLILSSYDPPFSHLRGVVIDKNSSLPIDSAQITIMESYLLYTDSAGVFEKIRMRGVDTDLELLVEKKGYQSKFISFSGAIFNPDSAVIKLQPTYNVNKPALSRNQLRFVNSLIKIAFSFLNVFTLIFILVNSEIRLRYIWITGILFINLIFNLLFLDYNLISYEIIHAPFFMTGYWNNPYSLKIALPIISIVFWILYLIKSPLIKANVLETRNDSKVMDK